MHHVHRDRAGAHGAGQVEYERQGGQHALCGEGTDRTGGTAVLVDAAVRQTGSRDDAGFGMVGKG